jgi:CubicO group peptidase (beta-lactamase class C family)
MTTRDMCRLGWLWRNFGNWDGRQLVPEEWLREATVAARIASQQSASDPLTHGSRAYGHGFWCNDEGQLWPDFPRDSFAAAGAWNRLIWVCPSLELVVAQNPGIRAQRPVLETRVLNWVFDALAAS